MKQEADYYLWFNEEQHGPFTLATLKRMSKKDEIGPETLYWREGMQEWASASQLLKHKSTARVVSIFVTTFTTIALLLVSGVWFYAKKADAKRKTAEIHGCLFVVTRIPNKSKAP